MNTSDPRGSASVYPTSVPANIPGIPGSPGLPAGTPASAETAAIDVHSVGVREARGLPDISQLTAWANELFRAGPTETALPVGEPSVANVAQVAPTAPASSPFDPSGSDLSGFDPSGFADYRIPASSLPELGLVPASLTSRQSPNRESVPYASQAEGGSLYFLEHAHAREAVSEPSFSRASALSPGVTSVGLPSAAYTSYPQPQQPSSRAPVPESTVSKRQFDAASFRRDFPILSERVNGKPLIWLDNAATTHKPQSVIDRLSYFYEHENSNIHRAAHTLAARSTDAYEAARDKVRRFLNAPATENIVFVRGATEAINLVAQSWGRRNVRAGDEVIITWLEHHANIVPWQMLCAEVGARLLVAPVDDTGQVRLDEYEKLFSPRTRIASLAHVSNALGTITPIEQMVAIARRHGARVLVDGAQAVSHMRVDVQALDADFYVFSGHKVFGPTGIGVLYGKSDLLAAMPPWQGGGNMIADVTFEKTVYNPPPGRFEAGTGNIADAVGLGAALDYLERIGMDNVARYEHELLGYGTARLLEVPRLRLIGTAREKAGVLSFVIPGIPTEQIGAALAQEGIAVRAGHHCAQPALRRFGLEATVRPSLALYNTCEDLDALVAVLKQLQSHRLV